MCLPNFSTQPYDFLMCFLLSSFEEFDPFAVALFQGVNLPFSSADASTVLSSEPKEFVLYVEELAMTVMAGMSDGVDAVSEDLQVAIVGDSGNRWYGWEWSGVFRHKKKNLYHR